MKHAEPMQPVGALERFAQRLTAWTGSTPAFITSLGVIVAWGASGRFFGYSDTWQLVINTGTTIVTFLMVFLIQSTQNRDTVALQLKLDELILATRDARNDLALIEEGTERDIETARAQVHARSARENGGAPARRE